MGYGHANVPTLDIGERGMPRGSVLGVSGNLEGCAWGAEVRTGGPTLAYCCPLYPLRLCRNC